jgi:hypothetical protein
MKVVIEIVVVMCGKVVWRFTVKDTFIGKQGITPRAMLQVFLERHTNKLIQGHPFGAGHLFGSALEFGRECNQNLFHNAKIT